LIEENHYISDLLVYLHLSNLLIRFRIVLEKFWIYLEEAVEYQILGLRSDKLSQFSCKVELIYF